MTDSILIRTCLSSALALISCTSAFVLSLQRVHLHKTQKKDPAPLRFDQDRDLTVLISNDTNRLTRTTFSTSILLILSALSLYDNVIVQHPENWLTTVSACIQLITWLYTFVLVLVSHRYKFPNKWGWILNVHLCILYTSAWCISVYDLYEAYTLNPTDSWLHMLPYTLTFFLSTDLVYTTATAQRGQPFVDEHGKQVANINVASIFSILYFQWATPLIKTAYKNKKLTEEDLPILPPLFRGYNLYYIFGSSRGNSLLKRIYRANKKAIIIQVILAFITSCLYYVPAYFVNQLLLLIQSINHGQDRGLIEKGFVTVISLGASIFILGILTGQLWYYASSSVQVRIKAMLNIEIYRKTLRRRDLAVASPKFDDDENMKNNEDNKENSSEVKPKEDASSSTGMIVNLMSTDSNRISEFSVWWFSVISAPVELVVGIYFLYKLLGKSCFLGLLAMIVVLPINHYNAKIFAKTQDKLMESRDKRVSLMNEVLQGIRQIKFFAWETNWEKRIMEAREVELHHLGITYLSDVLFTFLWQGSPILVTLVSFWSFTKLEGQQLTAPIAFTAITVFNELRFALNILPEVFIEWLQALISIRRIDAYLNEDEVEPVTNQYEENHLDNSNANAITIGFEHATVGWSQQAYTDNENRDVTADGSNNGQFILKDLNFTFPNNELSLISGSTGSGKTLMMLSLLGEAIVLEGRTHCPRQAVADTVSDDFALLSKDIDPKDWLLPYALAFVSQTSWLQNASIRDNILFGLPYIESRYRETLYACALDKDLKILEDGDQTEIGEKGITLSGGQKARVSLARAVYSRAQNVLMDDVLSAVDAHTAKHLYEKCLLGPLMKTRTRILITHHVKLCAKGCGYIVHIDNGSVDVIGTPSELRQSGKLASIFESEEEEIVEEISAEEEAIENTLPATDDNDVNQKKPRVLVEEETRAFGMVKLRLYKMYINMVGSPFFWAFMVILIMGSRVLDITESWWIKKWSQSYETESNAIDGDFTLQQQSMISQSKPVYAYRSLSVINNSNDLEMSIKDSKDDSLNFYMGVYCLITMTNIVVGAARFAVLYWGVLRANKLLYAELLHRVFRAPLRFFDTTPIGRILNRFSKDFETIDSSIPNDVLNFIIQWIIVFSSMLTVSAVLPVFIFPMLIIVVINIWLGIMFVSTSRELKRMDSVSRSPLFSHFTETIIGVSTIRAFGATRQFLQQMLKYIDDNARPYYFTWLVNRWVSVRYAFTGAVINSFTGAIILLNIDRLDSALAGFCLSFVLLFTDQMFWGIRRYTSLEMSFNAVERVVEFMEMNQEAPAITQIRAPAEWPTSGKIEVTDLEIRYAADLDPVLKGISFSVRPQEKVGIVGRTGSGKSTLALSFFRFVEASKGAIVIDGIDIRDLGTEDLRSNLTIIPQDPTLFSGSLRSNMDPFDQFTDENIFAALRRVHLLPKEGDERSVTSATADSESTLNEVNANVFKDLDTPVTEGGKNFSQGQRQLLCLARALLKRSRIVLMDEATASVDFETDKAIQKTISTEFADSTILCIAHRLHTVIEYDRILVLDQGKVIEFDSPLTLINNPESSFYKMCRNSGEFDNLMNLARLKHELVDISN
ncbi:P-loop containing nucleoside triphosphate hydrolase protein [Cokeromyces recurvatus]|uniref:P-loop containing nucleoside triphosphate hydrolase protein n=1 Tax=Cokeromyces recurvatus TaxID=90255 RepID=UPI00221EC49B|nr:P-loop containing nucleoside triphosphate hydrolase protein [Cokeromyces recurvatus]KAI7904063.1 P-loop containing nucleoside triphosphate hydrolase protein [Cokeromyces recurvatus]